MNWYLLYAAVGVVWLGGNAVVIVLQRRPAASTIAWLFALVFLPVAGYVLYRLIGPLRLERRKRRRVVSRRVVDEGVRGMAALDAIAADHHQLAMVPISLGGAPPLRAESVAMYFDGASAYDAIFTAVATARHHVHLEYYIWEPGEIGTRLRDLLIERARAGVTVRLLLDGTGTRLSRRFLRPLRDAGAKIAWFNPIRLATLRSRRADFRNHRKIIVCDGRIGFTGGMNIADAHTARQGPRYWRDTHLRLVGPAVWPIQRLFFEDWHFAAEELLPVSNETVPPPVCDGDDLVQIVASGPDETSFGIHKLFFAAINEARRRIWLTTPYFVPDDAMVTGLATAALRGVDVRVILPAHSDSRLVDLAARSYFPELVETGVKFYSYQPRFIHSKTMLVDDDVAVVGTANFDNRSFRLDFELVAVLYGVDTAQQLEAAFQRDLGDCREIAAAEVTDAPFVQRFGIASARLLSPLL